MENIEFKVCGRVIIGTTVSKGELFTAKASLMPGDTFSELIGKQLVKYRLEVLQRRRDLESTNEVIETLKDIIETNEYNVYHRFIMPSQVSKHWMRFNQEACEERKSQLENIAFAETMIDVLSKSEGNFEKMHALVDAGKGSETRKEHLHREIDAIAGGFSK